jgi:hypothetical protein
LLCGHEGNGNFIVRQRDGVQLGKVLSVQVDEVVESWGMDAIISMKAGDVEGRHTRRRAGGG